ncbi:MAG: hypothetical protein M9894_30460 [Planctomycetes bacterium]|nr:hypothetical protein [Planctomycetota bacterium]
MSPKRRCHLLAPALLLLGCEAFVPPPLPEGHPARADAEASALPLHVAAPVAPEQVEPVPAPSATMHPEAAAAEGEHQHHGAPR